ncbi:MAG: energy-coupling factor ABC transporter permease [Planctomycetota bacterium]
MHIAPGTLSSPWVLGAGLAASAGAVAAASARLRSTLSEDRAPLIGVLGAFVFAAQMINFALPGMPVSGHLMGAALLTVLLGPAAAIVALAAVLLVQALLFQDGGLLEWGANTFNMAVIGSLVAHGIHRLVNPRGIRGLRLRLGAGLAAFASLLAAAAACALELVLCGNDPALVFAGVLGVHLLIAIGEAVVTVLSLEAILAVAGGTPAGGILGAGSSLREGP